MNKFAPALLGLAVAIFAIDTQYWSQDTQAEFEKGTLKQISLRNDGLLSLAPVVRELADPSLPYLWSAVAAPNGNIYAAGGPASTRSAIFELNRAGQLRTFAEVDGMNIFALALDREGRLYAATSPDGKIYRFNASGAAEVFYDPKAKYIWALAFLPDGDLLAATGDKGELHRITPAGQGRVWLKIDEDHIRSLAVGAGGLVYAGTEPNGLILRVDAQGNPFVLYQTGKREITALAVRAGGGVFASAIGQRSAGPSPLTQLPPVVAPPPPATPGAGPVNVQVRPAAAPTPQAPMPPIAVPGGSEVFRLDADGAPLKLWSHPTDIVYALAVDAAGHLLAGTGNKGNLYRIEGPARHTLVSSFASSQITGFVRDGARTIAVTGNIGKILEVGPGLAPEGVYESNVFDAGGFTLWGRMHTKEVLSGGVIRYETRSGNLDRPTQLWSPWAPLQNGRIVSPPARFLQWRAVFSGGQAEGPSLSQVDVAYQPRNVPPRIDVVEPTPANYRFPAPSTTIVPASRTLTLPAIGQAAAPAATAKADGSTFPALTYSRGMIGARWLASDENGDTLEFSIEIKGENEQSWKPLKDKLKDRYYSYDATGFADGRYQVRITATDAPSNALGEGLTHQAASPYFLIDNTPPAIRDLDASPAGGKVNLRFRAVDALSVVTKAEISLNGGEWTIVNPTVRLADSKELDFQLQLDRPSPGELTIAVRLTDEFDNQSVDRITVR
jgi:outer membrane protein assembly factor BamB